MNRNNRQILAAVAGIAVVGAAILAIIPGTISEPAPASPASPASPTTAATRTPEMVIQPGGPATAAAGPGRDASVMFAAGWGSGPDELGHDIPEEGAPEGPMSFVVDDRGRMFVLDQINRRVQVFEPGEPTRAIPVGRETFQDLALRADGGLALLDRLAGKVLVLLDEQGGEARRVSLVGDGVPEGGAVTALFQRADGSWVEVAHGRLVRLADADGRVNRKRQRFGGRPTRDGRSVLRARLERPANAVVTIVPLDGTAPREVRVGFPIRIGHLVTLASDAAGRIFVAAHLMQLREGPPFDVLESRVELVVLDSAGGELARKVLPASNGPEEQFRSIRIGPDGAVYQLVLGSGGATMRRWLL